MRSDPPFERPWPLLRANRFLVGAIVVLIAGAAVWSMSLVGPAVLGRGAAQGSEPFLTAARRLMAHGKHD
ncbi:MAG: hypothetical protein EHM24_24825 [Acidobacteria bacterium]|nr:MAG: hypothetical protein EHM24_24825 [Acidobacteriota bacterium]RPJ85159.1 MAG: hypothetical protein EHM13_01940 [Acidobacteriota bacterium]